MCNPPHANQQHKPGLVHATTDGGIEPASNCAGKSQPPSTIHRMISTLTKTKDVNCEAELRAASSRHTRLQRLLQWVGIYECSTVYRYGVMALLLGNFSNTIYLIHYETSTTDETTYLFYYYTSKVAHVLYELFGLAVYVTLVTQLQDCHWEDGSLRQPGGFKQLLRADADIFKFESATSNEQEMLHKEVTKAEGERKRSVSSDLEIILEDGTAWEGEDSEMVLNPGIEVTTNPAAPTTAPTDAIAAVIVADSLQAVPNRLRNWSSASQRHMKHIVMANSNNYKLKYHQIMRGLERRIVVFFVTDMVLGVGWTTFALWQHHALTPWYAVFSEILYLLSRFVRQAAIAVSAFLLVVLLRSHIQRVRELVMCVATSKWRMSSNKATAKASMNAPVADEQDREPLSPSNSAQPCEMGMSVTWLSHSGEGAKWVTQSVADALEQMLQQHVQLQRSVYDMYKSSAPAFGLFTGFTLLYSIIAIFFLGIVLEQRPEQHQYSYDSAVLVEVLVIQAQNLMLIVLTLFWIVPTTTLLTREARKIRKTTCQTFATVEIRSDCSLHTHMKLHAVQRCFDNNPPVYQFNGSVVDNEFVQRSIAVLCATFFFALNIWLSDVYQ